MTSDLEVFIPFYTCKNESDLHWDRQFHIKKSEGRRIHLELLQACIASVRKEGIGNIKIIDGSFNTRLRESDVDAEIVRNDKHGLAPAINIAAENAREDFMCLMPASLVGVGNIQRMALEKKMAEEKFGKPVCLVDDTFYYPTNDEWLLDHADVIMAKPVEWVKNELSKLGFESTEDGQAIAKEKVASDWEPCYYIGPNFLVNKDRLFEVGGADERCIFHRHADGDLAFRWFSFEYLVLFANSSKMHRLHNTAKLLCKEIDEEERKQGYFEAGDKYEVHPQDWHLYNEEYRTKPWVYREWLKEPYRQEYDHLRKKPFILGRVESNAYFQDGIRMREIENGIKIWWRGEFDKGVIAEVFEEDVYKVHEIPKEAVVIDIGAHIGTFTLRCAYERGCTVYAYEPCSKNYDVLVKNIALNHLENRVKAFKLAIANCSETRRFYFQTKGSDVATNSSLFLHEDMSHQEELVECTTLKSVFEDNHIFSCDVLKIDCEEAEKEIFDSASAPYMKLANFIMLEWHNYDGSLYADYLNKLGFLVVLTGCGYPAPPYHPSFARGILYARKY